MPDLRGVSIRAGNRIFTQKRRNQGREPEAALRISQGMETGSAKRLNQGMETGSAKKLNQGMTSGAVVALAAAVAWRKLSINHKQILLLYVPLKNGGYIDFKRE